VPYSVGPRLAVARRNGRPDWAAGEPVFRDTRGIGQRALLGPVFATLPSRLIRQRDLPISRQPERAKERASIGDHLVVVERQAREISPTDLYKTIPSCTKELNLR